MAWEDVMDKLKFSLALVNDKETKKAISNAAVNAYAADMGLTAEQMRSYAQAASAYNTAQGHMYAQDIASKSAMYGSDRGLEAERYRANAAENAARLQNEANKYNTDAYISAMKGQNVPVGENPAMGQYVTPPSLRKKEEGPTFAERYPTIHSMLYGIGEGTTSLYNKLYGTNRRSKELEDTGYLFPY